MLASGLFIAGCVGPPAEPSACDGLSDKMIGITREDYSNCAEELLSELEGLDLYLERMVRQDDTEARPSAQEHLRRLRHLMDQVGFQADIWREAGQGNDRTVQRWPDSGMRWFNQEVSGSAAHFRAVLGYPNEDNLRTASEHYNQARQAYGRFRK